MSRIARFAALGLAGVLVVVLVGVLLVAGTDPGRDWVRGLALDAAAEAVEGRLHVGEVGGNLLSNAVLHDVIIEDDEGAPFLRAETVEVGYALLPLLRGELILRNLHVENPVVVLSQPPGEPWNFQRIFPTDPESSPDTTSGFVSSIVLHDVSVSGGWLTVRLPWEPEESLDGAADSRARIEEVPGGWQQVMEFRELHADFSSIRLLDPDADGLLFDLETGQFEGLPFRPPAMRVTDLAARIRVIGDSILFDDLSAELPGTRLSGSLAWSIEAGGGQGATDVSQLALADFRWLRPDLPTGEAAGQVAFDMGPERTHLAARDVTIAMGSAQVAGHLEVAVGDRLELGDTEIAFQGVHTELVQRLLGPDADPLPVAGSMRGVVRLPDPAGDLAADGWAEFREPSGEVSRVEVAGGVGMAAAGGIEADALHLTLNPVRASLLRQINPEIPVGGIVTGSATLTGPLDGTFEVAADLVHSDPRTGRSRVLADGEVNAMAAALNDVRLRLAPVQVALLKGAAPDLPVGGVVEGTVVISETPADRLAARVDLMHTDTMGQSQVEGTVAWMGQGPVPEFEVDLVVPALSLPTVGRFAPAAGLAGTVRGDIQGRGTVERPSFAVKLIATDSGSVLVEGSLDMRGPAPGYDVRATLDRLDASELSREAPTTALSGWLELAGTGTEPATANVALAAELVDRSRDPAQADSTRIRATTGDGILSLERGYVAFGPARAEVDGTFGLVAGRSGTLDYIVEVDSLRGFSDFVPEDTTRYAPRPLPQARRVAAARLDSIRIAKADEVERAATGGPPPPALVVDSLRAVSGDALSGSVRAEGTLVGNLERFGVNGMAEADEVVALGSTARAIRVQYTLADFMTPDADVALDVELDEFTAVGFAFDSARVDLGYRGIRNQGEGTLVVGLFQDEAQDYRMASEFRLAVDRRELTFVDMALRFDTVTWTAPHPGSIRLTGGDLEVDSLVLVTPVGPARVAVNGSLPETGEVNLRVDVERLPLGQVPALLQDTTSATGLVDLEMRLTGTRASPLLEGSTALSGATLGERPLPDLTATWSYADRSLQATAEATDDRLLLAALEAELPLDLRLEAIEGPRMLDEPLYVRFQADSLPLESIPSFTAAVADVQGRLRADLTVAGSFDDPELDGSVGLSLASLRIVPAGVRLRDLVGTTRFVGREVVVDSLRAISGGGTIRVSGRIDAAELTRPTFDLALTARQAHLLDNELGRVTTDADLTLIGPIDTAHVGGTVRVREGVLRVPEVGEGRSYISLDAPEVRASIDATTAADEILPGPNPFLENLRVDVGLRVDRNTWVRNSDTNVEIHTPEDVEPLRIRMNVEGDGLVLDGSINADRGEYTFSGRVFSLTTGSAVFVPGGELDPLLQLTANYEVEQPGREALVIQIHVAGTLTDPQVTLESSAQPPLPESDLLSYLAFGRSSTSLFGAGGSGLAGEGIGSMAQQQLATLAIGALVDEAVADVEREGTQAGFDIFRVRPADLPPELAFSGQVGNFLRGTEVLLGRYVGNRLFVAAQGRTTTDAWPGLRLEYRAPGGFLAEGVWEPRYLPREPTLMTTQAAQSARVLGAFIFWSRRF
ncbi:MAG: translocation/assembly module TamB domain-containing protein [Gemmatimonadota bacterium]